MDSLVSIFNTANDAVNEAEAVEFATKSVDRLVSDWSYAANTSNQAKFGSYTLALATLLQLPSFPTELAVGLARKVLQEDLKAIYRALTTLKQAQTVPILKLLRELAKFVPQLVYTTFDFTLRALPRVLTQQPFRKHFLQFYIALITASAPSTRRDLFANRKIFSSWIGKLGNDDDEEILQTTVDLLHDLVLKDTIVFTKTTKMGLFNDWTLENMQRLLSASSAPNSAISPELVEKLSRFLILLFCDRTYGVRMPGENRLALSFLKIVKPWENVAQMDVVVRLLGELSDVFVPYFDSLDRAYPLSPKESMWWFAYSTLHIRALKLPVSINKLVSATAPVNAVSLRQFAPKVEVAGRFVLPKTVTKTALMQCWRFESNLIRFQTAQIVLFALQRLVAVKEVYETQNWDAEMLVDEVFARLPDLHVLAKVEGAVSLLRIAYLQILQLVCRLRPQAFAFDMPLTAFGAVKGLSLIESELVLEVQTYTSDQTRWWTPSHDSNSLFTQLLRLATHNLRLATKCSELLQKLVQPTQLFADMPTLAHPIDALLFTLNNYNSPVLWALIDQAVQRAVRSPYAYIDQINSARVSPFAVAVVEQWKFVIKQPQFTNDERQAAENWLLSFVRALVVLGEDRDILFRLVTSMVRSLPAVNDLVHLKSLPVSNEYFDFVLDASDESVMKRTDLVFKISNHLELMATLFRVIETSNYQLCTHLLASIPTNMYDLVASNPAAFMPFVGEKSPSKLARVFLHTIYDDTRREVSWPALTATLEAGIHWELGLPLLSTEFLTKKLQHNDTGALELSVLTELNKRQHPLDPATIHSVLSSELVVNNDILNELAKNMELWPEQTFSPSEALDIMMRVTNSPRFVASLVRISGRYPQRHPLSLTGLVLVAGAKYAKADLDAQEALGTAKELLIKGDPDSLTIMAELISDIPPNSNIWDQIQRFVENAKQTNQSVLLTSLLRLAVGGQTSPEFIATPAPFLGRYLKIAVYQLTRQFAENLVTEPSFIAELVTLLPSNHLDVWQHVHHNALNALLEAGLRYETESTDLRTAIYQLVSVLSSQKSAHQTTLAQLTTLFAHHKPASICLEQAIAIYFLFNNRKSSENNATLEVEQAVLVRYGGSLAAKDRILLAILRDIEAIRQRSWMENLQSLDVRPASNLEVVIDDYQLDPLVVVRGDVALFVTLDEQMIRNTIQSFEATNDWLLGLNSSTDLASYHPFKSAVAAYEVLAPANAGQIYDSYFLTGFVVSAKYLYENLEVFLTSGLVSYVICTLVSPPPLNEIAIKIIKHVFSALPASSLKDQAALRLLLGKLLMLHSECQNTGASLPSHIPGIAGQIALVLGRPNHFMHEKVSQWLLARPQITSNDIPLFKFVTESTADLKMREMLWMVNTLKSGCVDSVAVLVYIRQGVMEWCLAQLELVSPRAHALKEAIGKFINRIEEVPGASELLIERSGVLASADLQSRAFNTADPRSVVSWALS